jgi:hypothetical protein
VQETRWEDISMDFVVRLPECERLDGIWVLVDRLSMMRHFNPCHATIYGVEFAKIVVQEVVHHH